MKIGLYFGSFNPIHVGHLIIASHIVNNNYVDQVWFIVSPQNPLKKSSTLLNEYHRLHLVKLAINEDVRLKASEVEFKLPRPSYTIDTLIYLEEKYPSYHFQVIMGGDSYQNIKNWKNYNLLLSNYEILIYNRKGFDISKLNPNTKILQSPLLDISATDIRSLIQEKKSIRYLVPEACRIEIEKSGYYLSHKPAN